MVAAPLFAEQEYTDSLTEFHIVGGLNPELPFEYYLDLLRGLKKRFPAVHLKAFTMVELDFFRGRLTLTGTP